MTLVPMLPLLKGANVGDTLAADVLPDTKPVKIKQTNGVNLENERVENQRIENEIVEN